MSNLNPIDRREQTTVIDDPVEEHREVVTEDLAASNRQGLFQVSSLIGLLFGILEGLIGIRILLKLIAANPANEFARFIYDITAIFLAPFRGLTATPSAGGVVLEISSIIAMIIYALVAWAIIQLVWLLFYHPASRTVTHYDRGREHITRY